MSNNCTHCLHKGDIKACKATECHAHESWYALEMIAQNADLLEALENIENDNGSIPKAIWDMRNAAIAKAKGEDQ